MMVQAYRTTAIVQPGHRIEITAPSLPEGEQVQVVVIPRSASRPLDNRSGLEIIESYKGEPLFGSVEAIDRYINEERDSWDR